MDSACGGCAVRDVLGRVAQLSDGPDPAAYALQFTEDAIWDSPANPAVGKPPESRRGRAAIEEGARARRERGLQGPGSATRHVVTTVSVAIVDETTARAVSYWMFYASTDSSPILTSMGRYDDELRLEAGAWRISRRSITLG